MDDCCDGTCEEKWRDEAEKAIEDRNAAEDDADRERTRAEEAEEAASLAESDADAAWQKVEELRDLIAEAHDAIASPDLIVDKIMLLDRLRDETEQPLGR